MAEYVYLGDRVTRPDLKGAACNAVRRADGKRIWRNGKAVVDFENGERHVVLARRLRRLDRA